jgi:hypothetical protein
MLKKGIYLVLCLSIGILLSFTFIGCDLDDNGGENGGTIVNQSGQAWIANLDGYRFGYVFRSNGTFDGIEESGGIWEVEISGTYSTSGNSLNLTGILCCNDCGEETETFSYSVSGSTLTMTRSYGAYSETLTLTRTNVSIGTWTVPTNHTTLINGQWRNGNLTNSNNVDWYSFSVTNGQTYYMWNNDICCGDGTKTGEVRVIARYSDGTQIFRESCFWSSPEVFTANRSGIVYIRVSPDWDTGTYAIVFSTNSTRP